jgi:hypothetical protein
VLGVPFSRGEKDKSTTTIKRLAPNQTHEMSRSKITAVGVEERKI